MIRRKFLLGSTTGFATIAIGGSLPFLRLGNLANAGEGNFAITKSEAEWRAVLSDAQYAVLREEDTERPFSSPLNEEKRAGIFHCAGCDLRAYSAKAKYDSGTGWPSFWESLPDAIGTKEDDSLFMTRIECHCRRCGGHFGHIFDDGPAPTGKRHCLNGLALAFKPDEA